MMYLDLWLASALAVYGFVRFVFAATKQYFENER